MVIGCGDDETSSASEDGGVEQDLREVTDRIDNVEGELDDLTGIVDGVNDDVENLDGKLDMIETDLDERLQELEDPDILSCTEFEVCIPMGVMDVTGGISGIIDLVCEHEIDCCSESELNLKFGPGVEDVADCRALFTDMVENGFSPDFWYASLTPSVVYQVVGVVQALNDPRVRVEIDEEGVQECIDSLNTECPQVPEPGPATDPECYVGEQYEEDPCSLDNLLNGMQEEGELCGDYAFGELEDIPECMDGFYCSFDGASKSYSQGICAKLPEEGDRCQDDEDCDPFGMYAWGGPMATQLYCDLSSAQCEPLGDVGDPCEFIDDTFTLVDEYNPQFLNPQNRSATSRDCRNGLTCDPTSNECVANCSIGRFCTPNQDPFNTCGEDALCNVTEEPELYENHGLGICWEAIAQGEVCTLGSECATGKCEDDCNQDTQLCECSEVLEPGDECDTPGADDLCSTGWCGTNGECAELCNCDENVEGSCDPIVEGPARVGCADGYYCDPSTEVLAGNLYMNVCEPVIANGTTCEYSFSENSHVTCNSGFCDPGTNQCAAKVAADAACPSGVDEQCRSTQYCNNSNLCRTYRAAGESCDIADVSGLECADGLSCVDGAASDICRALAGPGDDCNDESINAPPCDDREDSTINCVDIDGAGSGTVFQCYSTDGGYADGVDCGFNDFVCASGWCRPDAATAPTSSTCEQPLEEGDPCDTANQTIDVCGEGLYCDRTRSSTEGECTEQAGPGEACNPFFQGGDCLYGGQCVFTKDQYLCDRYSVDESVERFCGGG